MKSDGKNRNVLLRPVDATRGGEEEMKEGKGMGGVGVASVVQC